MPAPDQPAGMRLTAFTILAITNKVELGRFIEIFGSCQAVAL
jgi:hypothetical protein